MVDSAPPKTMKKTLLLVVVLLLLVGGYLLLGRKPSPQERGRFGEEKTTQELRETRQLFQEKAEQGFKIRQYLPLIQVYEDLLAKYPDNRELKEKLAELYTQTGQEEKAQALKHKAPSPAGEKGP
jgi:hypothetical protein